MDFTPIKLNSMILFLFLGSWNEFEDENMTTHPKKNHLFQSTVTWDGETGGNITIKDFPEIKIDTPTEWGGQSRSYCPDQLFVSCVAGCLLETFLSIKKKMRLNLIHLTVPLQMTIKQARDGYHVWEIEGKIQATVGKGEKEKGETCAQLAEEYCHLIRLIEKAIPVKITYEVTET
jgi:organic hydroperoxide reductase OsmC/OhrA